MLLVFCSITHLFPWRMSVALAASEGRKGKKRQVLTLNEFLKKLLCKIKGQIRNNSGKTGSRLWK